MKTEKTYFAQNSVTGNFWDGKGFSGTKLDAVAVDASTLIVIRFTYQNVVAYDVPADWNKKIAKSRKLMQSSLEMYRTRGLNTTAQKHNSIVAMRVGMSEKLASRSYHILTLERSADFVA